MAKTARRRSSKSWIGKYLRAKEALTVPVLSGSDTPIAEIKSGQFLKVIEVQEDGWLRCKLLQDVFFKNVDKKRVHAKDLLIGVHTEHDITKFDVRKARVLKESYGDTDSYLIQRWGLTEIGSDACKSCGEQKELYTSERAPMLELCVKCWRETLEDYLSTVSSPKMEGILELLPEIPDGYANTDFGEEDRENIRQMIEQGYEDDEAPATREIVDLFTHFPDAERVPLDQVDLDKTPLMDKADIVSTWIVRVLTPEARRWVKGPVGESIQKRPRPKTVKEVTAMARRWIAAKRTISELKTQLARFTSKSRELEEKLLSVVGELAGQEQRVDNVVLALQRKAGATHKAWYGKAIELLDCITTSLAGRAKKLKEETEEYVDWLVLEQDQLVQGFSWAGSFSKRLWRWLRKTERLITQAEQMVFYSD